MRIKRHQRIKYLTQCVHSQYNYHVNHLITCLLLLLIHTQDTFSNDFYREWKRQRKTLIGERHRLVASCTYPNWIKPAIEVRAVSRIEPEILQSQGRCSNH